MDVAGILTIMLSGLWLFLPAMLPNSAAVIFGGGTPVDFGRSMKDGRRILGDGKTWRGLFGGALSGVLLGILLIGISSFWDPSDYWGYGPFWSNVGILLCLSFGALFGDMLGSFLKRRLGIGRGEKFAVMDQYDFVIGAFIVTGVLFPHWVYGNYIEGWNILALLFLLAIMFGVHRVANNVAYRWGLKDEPW
jgi:CDP-2,3-bis-(O-geranylgeranyl)-sn-glycerol synthase